MDIRTALRENPLVLAPMAGITDTVFRGLMKTLGAGVVVSELVSARGLLDGGRRTRELTRFTPQERPVGIQLFGEDPTVLGRAAATIEEWGADFVDLNLGCPVPKVVKRGAGAAMLKDPARLEGVLKQVRSHISIPLTIKIRAGWDESSITAPDCVKAASEAGVAWVAIHGRTRHQGYSGRADWDLIARCKEVSGVPIIGNGDILTPEDALERFRETGCDAIMIGRGTLRNPWIFRQIRALQAGGRHEVQTGDFLTLLSAHRRALDQDPAYRNPGLHLRKFSAWYSHGYPGSAAFRHRVFQARSISEAEELYTEFFDRVKDVPVTVKPLSSFFTSGEG